MKAILIRTIFLSIAATMIVAPEALAQRQLGKKKGPTSKIYLAEAVGESEIQTGDKIYAAKQATAFDAPGTVIETKAGAHNAFVYSNGTGMFVDENTRVEIDRFVQEPFKPERNSPADAPFEPSISQSPYLRMSNRRPGLSHRFRVPSSTSPQASLDPEF